MTQFRIWPPIILVALIFALQLLPKLIKDSPDWIWLIAVIGPLICCLLIIVWWIAASLATAKEKIFGALGIVIAGLITVVTLHPTMQGPAMLTLTIPMGIIGFATGAIVLSKWLSKFRILAIIGLSLLCFLFSLLFRNEGMWGNGRQELRWRWTESAEEKMLAEKKAAASPTVTAPLETTQWTGFRGPNRDSKVTNNIQYSSNWSANPPKEIWRAAIGPGWASFAVAGNQIYTQEQRGTDEYMVCYAADTGQELWNSRIGGRFDDPMGGPGPRATPELSEGILFGLTAKGILVAVDATNGKQKWKTNIAQIADRKPPTWGFASSPLLTDNLAIVHAGGDGKNGTLAFDRQTGDLKWSAPAGDHSYSSPQLTSILGKEYIAMSTNKGIRLLAPETGKVIHFHESVYRGYRTLQPQKLGENALLLQASGGPGTVRLQYSQSGDTIKAKEVWQTTWLKSDFNDCVIHQGYLYGFNGSTLVCLDIKTGERKWRGGRYGKGQILLLESSGLLLAISETGVASLIQATPEKHEALSSLQIFEDKAWSHPIVVGDRLYLRNASEAVCYQLPVSK